MTTTDNTSVTDQTSLDTETFNNDYLGEFSLEGLRTKPELAGKDLFTVGTPVSVYVDLGRRRRGSTGPFSGGGYITITDRSGENDPSFSIDLSENDTIKLIGALALAVRDLRTAREALA